MPSISINLSGTVTDWLYAMPFSLGKEKGAPNWTESALESKVEIMEALYRAIPEPAATHARALRDSYARHPIANAKGRVPLDNIIAWYNDSLHSPQQVIEWFEQAILLCGHPA